MNKNHDSIARLHIWTCRVLLVTLTVALLWTRWSHGLFVEPSPCSVAVSVILLVGWRAALPWLP